jgi:hypothetical protein
MSDMAISGIGLNAMGFNRSFPAGAPSGPPPAGAKEMLSKTADLLGMSADDLKSQLDGGASISDIANALTKAVETLAAKLNMSGSDLLSQLEGGSSLSDIAGQAGVSMDQLTADLTQGLMFDARA